MIRKQYYTLSYIVNQIKIFQYIIQKNELSYLNMARGSKII